MDEHSLGAVERRFADLIWDNAPVTSSLLVQLAQQALSWKKSTTYTVLKRLCQKGIFENDGGTVRVLLSREEWYTLQSQQFVEDTFHGSLPAFLTAFAARKPLSDQEIRQLEQIISLHKGES